MERLRVLPFIDILVSAIQISVNFKEPFFCGHLMHYGVQSSVIAARSVDKGS
jgi:hypothetical protein